MTFIFSMFTISPRSTQNYLSMFNCCCSATSNSDIRTRLSAKSNSHTCTFTRGASHSLPSKCPSRVSKYNPNNRGLRGQPCFTSCWHLKLEVTPSLECLMHTISLAYITYRHRKKHPCTSGPANTCHNTSCGTILNAFLKSMKQQ